MDLASIYGAVYGLGFLFFEFRKHGLPVSRFKLREKLLG